jgi:hypothetical protein
MSIAPAACHDGSDPMLARDENGRPGAEICALALAKARDGGTLVLGPLDSVTVTKSSANSAAVLKASG